VTCGLCGLTYDEEGQGCRPSCPMARGCNLICCPNCGHGMPREGQLAQGLRKILVKLSGRPR